MVKIFWPATSIRLPGVCHSTPTMFEHKQKYNSQVHTIWPSFAQDMHQPDRYPLDQAHHIMFRRISRDAVWGYERSMGRLYHPWQVVSNECLQSVFRNAIYGVCHIFMMLSTKLLSHFSLLSFINCFIACVEI